jgi:hypothetical protein
VINLIEKYINSLMSKKTKPENGKPQKYPYQLRDSILGPAELAFHKALLAIIPSNAVILIKPRLADVFAIDRIAIPYPSEARLYFKKIAQMHVDFLLCHVDEMLTLLGIELSEEISEQPELLAREELIDNVFEAANLPLVRFKVKLSYDEKELIRILNPLWQSHLPPNCPKCDRPMLIRAVKVGEDRGKQFYVCPDYQNCGTYFPMTARGEGADTIDG